MEMPLTFFYHIWELKNHLRKLNRGRLSHFDGAFFYGMLAGFNGAQDNPYYNHYNFPTWSDVWEGVWSDGYLWGERIKKKVVNL